MGSQECCTKVVPQTLNPKWNSTVSQDFSLHTLAHVIVVAFQACLRTECRHLYFEHLARTGIDLLHRPIAPEFRLPCGSLLRSFNSCLSPFPSSLPPILLSSLHPSSASSLPSSIPLSLPHFLPSLPPLPLSLLPSLPPSPPSLPPSITHSFTHQLTHSYVHLFINAFTHLLTEYLNHSFIQAFISLLIGSFFFFIFTQLTFTVKDLDQDVLCITVFDRDFFSPNGDYPMRASAFHNPTQTI